jgi:N-acetylglucosamine-6-sulfatase
MSEMISRAAVPGLHRDLCPTFTELGGMVTATSIDGRSLVPLLHRQKVADWRTVTLIEHRRPVRNLVDPDLPSARTGNPTTYDAIRGLKSLCVEYANGDKEYHDLAADPDELRNSVSWFRASSRRPWMRRLPPSRLGRAWRAAWPDRTLAQR